MPDYLIYFNQQWVGDHSEDWFRSREKPSNAVVDEMKAAGGVRVRRRCRGGPVYAADATSGEVVVTEGRTPTRPSASAGSPSSRWPTTRPPNIGRARSPWAAAGRKRCAASGEGGGGVAGRQVGAPVLLRVTAVTTDAISGTGGACAGFAEGDRCGGRRDQPGRRYLRRVCCE